MKMLWKSEWPDWTMLLAMFGLALWRWPWIGDKVPVHWNSLGQVDRYGGKIEGLLALPCMSVGIYLLFLVMPRLDPGRANYAQFGGSYRAIRRAVLAMNLVVYGATLLFAAGHPIEMSSVVSPALGALFVVVGSVMGKVRPNWFIGIRTPWTLSSKSAWLKTHRVGGWTFIALGLLQIICGIALPSALALTSMMAMLITASLGLSAYSFLVWRDAPDKAPPANTLPADDPLS